MKLKVEKMISYAQLVKVVHKPKVSEQKKKELEMLKERTKTNRSSHVYSSIRNKALESP